MLKMACHQHMSVAYLPILLEDAVFLYTYDYRAYIFSITENEKICVLGISHTTHMSVQSDWILTLPNQLGYPLGLSVFLNDIIETRQIGGFCWR